jgi:hypothetical protein
MSVRTDNVQKPFSGTEPNGRHAHLSFARRPLLRGHRIEQTRRRRSGLERSGRVCVQKTPLSSSVAAKNVGDERQTSSNDNRFWRYPD